jgi:hypothetical protein
MDFPPLVTDYVHNYDSVLMDLVGIVTEGDAVTTTITPDNPIPFGTPVSREYRWNEYDFYGQEFLETPPQFHADCWLRYSYLQTPTRSTATGRTVHHYRQHMPTLRAHRLF